MGTPDTFGEHAIQLKNGECICKHYNVGDKTPLPDGVYIGFEGAVVIQSGVFLCSFPIESVLDKWGGQIDINPHNPLHQVVDTVTQTVQLIETLSKANLFIVKGSGHTEDGIPVGWTCHDKLTSAQVLEIVSRKS